jgi:hypothetical protein
MADHTMEGGPLYSAGEGDGIWVSSMDNHTVKGGLYIAHYSHSYSIFRHLPNFIDQKVYV